jgi:putative DNA primase/helicase
MAARRQMMDAAGHLPGIEARLAKWDVDPWILNCANGVIKLRTQEFRPRMATDLCMKQSPVVYDPQATCPLWEEAMDTWMCGDTSLVTYLQTALGYSLTGDTRQQCIFYNEGTGANGKDVFFTTIRNVMGTYHKTAAMSAFTLSKHQGNDKRDDLADLEGAVRMVVASEIQDGERLDEATVKLVTGGGHIKCRHNYAKEWLEYQPEWKPWFMANHQVVVTGTDTGIWRRVKRIPWNFSFEGNPKKREGFQETLVPEYPGILNWMLRGLAAYIANGQHFPLCQAVLVATAEMRDDQDTIGQFISETLEFKDTLSISCEFLHTSYTHWAIKAGYNPWGRKRFLKEFVRRYPIYSKYEAQGGKKSHGRTRDSYTGVGFPRAEQQPEHWDY